MGVSFEGVEQTVQDILRSKDYRVEVQQCFIKKHRLPLVSFKLNIPGPIKYNSLIKDIFDSGVDMFREEIKKNSVEIVEEKSFYNNSGPEYFAAFRGTPSFVKKITTSIEKKHALGRLFDFDVVNVDMTQLSRTDIGKEPRKCLLCEGNAFECGRSRTHTVSELTEHIIALAKKTLSI